jgi:tRNA G18 (ribose-2'-O)-methylase SpoU
MDDTRNVTDRYKGMPIEDIVADLDKHGIELEIAVENTERDFNMGTIVRSANAFGVRHVHVIGRKQWNKRGAMMTDKYLHLHYYADVSVFVHAMGERLKTIIAVDNIEGSIQLNSYDLPKNAVLVFGQEGPGISQELASKAKAIVAIEQFGSTRSINVGVAAGIVMYQWLKQNTLRGSSSRG